MASNRIKLVIAAVPEQCNIPLLLGLNSPIGRYLFFKTILIVVDSSLLIDSL